MTALVECDPCTTEFHHSTCVLAQEQKSKTIGSSNTRMHNHALILSASFKLHCSLSLTLSLSLSLSFPFVCARCSNCCRLMFSLPRALSHPHQKEKKYLPLIHHHPACLYCTAIYTTWYVFLLLSTLITVI